jgi:hypothetical protein
MSGPCVLQYQPVGSKCDVKVTEVGIANFFSGPLIANPLIFFLNPINANTLIFQIFQSANR